MRRVYSILAMIFLLAGCGGDDAGMAQSASTPNMPDDWSVTSDQIFARSDIRPISSSLGGRIAALRNTMFEVDGKRVKVNTLVMRTITDADNVMISLRAVKPDDFLLRNGTTIYEFVCANDAIQHVRQGKAHLLGNHGS
jgi:hypothetical protein